jgi:hypothetical protein
MDGDGALLRRLDHLKQRHGAAREPPQGGSPAIVRASFLEIVANTFT